MAVDQGEVYGLTTGVGALRTVDLDTRGTPTLRLWRSHAGGTGAALGDAEARATMLVRLHQLLRGGAGVTPDLTAGLARAVEAGAVPTLRDHGGLGTGDLTVLAQLGLTLAGELPWRSGGAPVVEPADTDGLGFLSSSAATIAVASLAVVRLADLLRAAEQVAALSHLALRGSVAAYDARVLAAKDDPFAAAVAARMRSLLDGPDGQQREPARLQDPFGLRALPQVHGAAEAAVAAAEQVLAGEIGASAENPLVPADDDHVLHHGQFMTQRLASVLDALRAALPPVLALSHARLSALLDARLTGLPAFLADGPSGSSGLMIAEYVAADLYARASTLSAPVTAGRTVLSLGLEEHASHSTWSARLCADLADLVPSLLACELVTAVRALRIAPDRALGAAAAGLLERCDWEHVAPDHVLGPELEAAAVVVRAGCARR
ncbi:histidine ammonia-lyase [Nocardioides luteus]|uniref:Histidine ammonia-lyase n=1 Tax=Nocardioides luteus TaxID=1844 RepID=A0ABQ5SR29_9ACTN|nr:histidine ammonia-lyase [Nocardioides luteus]GLJ66221.1 histidine ammonia-lyase [Nocardioides luteus]